MAQKRSRPSENHPGTPPARNLGTGNKDCGHIAPLIAPAVRKEKLRQPSWEPLPASPPREPSAGPRPKKSAPRYAELHASSAFSFLNGASLPEDLVEEAALLSIPAVALVDSNGVYGAPRFYKAAKAAGIKALV